MFCLCVCLFVCFLNNTNFVSIILGCFVFVGYLWCGSPYFPVQDRHLPDSKTIRRDGERGGRRERDRERETDRQTERMCSPRGKVKTEGGKNQMKIKC